MAGQRRLPRRRGSPDKAGVVDRLADLGYGMPDVVIAPTHTHAGPEEWTDWLEEQG